MTFPRIRNLFAAEETKPTPKDEMQALNDSLAKEFGNGQGAALTERQLQAKLRLEATNQPQQDAAEQQVDEDAEVAQQIDEEERLFAQANAQERAERYMSKRQMMKAFVNEVARDVDSLKQQQREALLTKKAGLEEMMSSIQNACSEIEAQLAEPEDRKARIAMNLATFKQDYRHHAARDGNAEGQWLRSIASARIDTSEPVGGNVEITQYYLSSALFKRPQATLPAVKDPECVAAVNEVRAHTFTPSK